MAGIEVNAGALDGLIAGVRRQIERKWASMKDAAEEVGQFGSKTAQSYTASRPGAKSGKAGRVQTGAMLEALRYRMTSFSLDLVEVQYGFVEDYEEYMRLQTVTGFTHNRSSDRIEPTFALRDSRGPVSEFARARVRDVF